MRSSLIFSVSSRFSNRYLLCRMIAASARKMHRDGISTSQSINDSLKALHNAEKDVEKKEREPLSAALHAEGMDEKMLEPEAVATRR
jgi:hypothetical protein